jgi:hypothetical protein
MRYSKFLYWTAWLGVAGAAAVAVAVVPSAQSAESASCPPGVKVDTYYEPPHPSPAKLTFDQPPENTIVRLRFNDSHAALKKEFPFSLVRGYTAPQGGLNNPYGLNARFTGNQRLTGQGANYIWSVGQGVQLSLEKLGYDQVGICLRLDPARLGVPAGLYSGTMGIAFQDQTRASVSVEATFRERWQRAALIAFLGVFLGVIVKALSEAAAIARSTGISGRQALQDYAAQLGFAVTLILAAISGIVTYIVLYAHDPDWGAHANDGLRLFGACFVVQMSSSEALAVVSRFAGVGPPTPPRIFGPN